MRECKPGPNHLKTARLIKALLDGPATRYELCDRADMGHKAVSLMIAALKAEKVIYVIDWQRDKGGRAQKAVYSLGDHADAPRKPTIPQQERSRKGYLRKLERLNACTVKTTFVGGGLWQ